MKERIGVPDYLIPKGYIGEKFGVLLVFLKGENSSEIKKKTKDIKRLVKEYKRKGVISK